MGMDVVPCPASPLEVHSSQYTGLGKTKRSQGQGSLVYVCLGVSETAACQAGRVKTVQEGKDLVWHRFGVSARVSERQEKREVFFWSFSVMAPLGEGLP